MAKVVASTPRRDDFALVLQPMFSDMAIPGMDFLSQLDWFVILPILPSSTTNTDRQSFHPSLEAHQQMAIALWNTMQLPARYVVLWCCCCY